MNLYEPAVREALMTIYLAAMQAGIPLGMAYFGEDNLDRGGLSLQPERIPVERVVSEVVPISSNSQEAAKALIAGYTAWASKEYLDWGLRKAEAELRKRPERLRVLLIIHDGEPVYRSKSASDWELSQAHLRSLEQGGFIPIGIHLGRGTLSKLKMLFTRLVNCQDGESLAEKLGQMLYSLA